MKNHPDLPIDAPIWLREADIENPIVEIANGRVIWRDGVWNNGTWHKGAWLNGTWHNGTWLGGEWQGGTWRNGTWQIGEWNCGTWHNGIWCEGTWENGTWLNGTWLNGTWYKGAWFDGTWQGGEWQGGKWRSGKELATRAYWEFRLEKDGRLLIGCKKKTIEEWIVWFEESDEVFEHARDSEEFALIKTAFYKFYVKSDELFVETK